MRGRLWEPNILVNAAGINLRPPLGSLTLDDWDAGDRGGDPPQPLGPYPDAARVIASGPGRPIGVLP